MLDVLGRTDTERDKIMEEAMVYRREGRANRMSLHNRSPFGGKPSVFVETDAEGRDWVCWGTYSDSKGGIAALSPESLAVGLIVSAVGTAVEQIAEGPGISNYFYLQGDPENGYSLAGRDAPDLLRAKIDQYEIAQEETGVKYVYKGYIAHGNGVVAVYRHKKVESLSLISF